MTTRSSTTALQPSRDRPLPRQPRTPARRRCRDQPGRTAFFATSPGPASPPAGRRVAGRSSRQIPGAQGAQRWRTHLCESLLAEIGGIGATHRTVTRASSGTRGALAAVLTDLRRRSTSARREDSAGMSTMRGGTGRWPRSPDVAFDSGGRRRRRRAQRGRRRRPVGEHALGDGRRPGDLVPSMLDRAGAS